MKTNNLHNNKGGFKVPNDYFENFEDQLLDSIASEEKETSTLPKKTDTGFKTPDTYFESFEDTLLKKIESQENPSKVISFFSRRNILYVSGIAAMIAIIISISITEKNDPFTFDNIDIADIQEYLDDGNAEFSDSEIAALLDEDTNLINTFNADEISDEELENYLSDEELEDEIIPFMN